MKIVVIGGSGLIGSNLVKRLGQLDHTVISASPGSGVNTITGVGLTEAVKNADVVVDVSNSPSFEDDSVMNFFQKSTTNLLTAAMDANVKNYIALSIVGTDRLPGSGYMRAKLAQENLIKASGMPYTILRSTQFFEFAARIANEDAVGNEVHISTGMIQPIASEETVAALIDIVVNRPLNDTVEVGGPERMPMSDFIRSYLTATGDPRSVIADEHALYFGVELNENSLVTGDNARIGKIKYKDWFSKQLLKT
jgi:uncharacterized protein YbjT (DUF2867 family)